MYKLSGMINLMHAVVEAENFLPLQIPTIPISPPRRNRNQRKNENVFLGASMIHEQLQALLSQAEEEEQNKGNYDQAERLANKVMKYTSPKPSLKPTSHFDKLSTPPKSTSPKPSPKERASPSPWGKDGMGFLSPSPWGEVSVERSRNGDGVLLPRGEIEIKGKGIMKPFFEKAP
jgi:hypothetical protein